MKDAVLWSRNTDWKILMVGGLLLASVVAGMVLPAPAPIKYIDLFAPATTSCLLIFAWGTFQLFRPTGWNRKWRAAEFIVVPLLWLALVVGVGLWFSHLQHDGDALSEMFFCSFVL